MNHQNRKGAAQPIDDLDACLSRVRAGDREAFDRVMTLLYKEIRRRAAAKLKREPGYVSLQATDLANVVYVRLAGSEGLTFANRACFFGLAATVMRHVLTDHAKAKARGKRGGGQVQIPLDEALALANERNIDFEALHEALDELESLNERHARIVDHRFFGGLSVEESAAALGVSPTTVKRELPVAIKWLRRRLRGLNHES